MRNKDKILIAVFFLFLFLIPTIEKGIHTHHRVDEPYSNASGALDSHCLICDFTLTDSNSPISANFSKFVPQTGFLVHLFIENISFQGVFLNLSSRAPPIA